VKAGVSMSVTSGVRGRVCRDVVDRRRALVPRRRLKRVDFPAKGMPSRHAVPDFDQPRHGPIRRKLGQAGLIPEAFGVRDGFGTLRCSVHGDVVGFGFYRKDFHTYSPSATSAAVITSITQVGDTSKAILQEISSGEGQAIAAPLSQALSAS